MEINFESKVAVVTGGTRGIGLAIAESFAREGACVAICSSTNENVTAAVKYLRERNLEIYGKVADVSSRESIFNFADSVEEELGGIDIWISNAGVTALCRVIDATEDEVERIINTNLKSVYYGGLIASAKMKKRGGGVLLNAVSFATKMPRLGSGVYAASKAAVYNLTKSLAAELAPYNIRVNGYIPGVIETELTRPLIQKNRAFMESCIALKRIGTSQDIANAVMFLASDKASYITGSFLEISGGKYCVQNPSDAWTRYS